jgi:phosphoglycerol geranylgeranyltransferase
MLKNNNTLLNKIKENCLSGKKGFILLLDPDKLKDESFNELIHKINHFSIDFIFVGGSLISSDRMQNIVSELKKEANCPVIIFPGNVFHIDAHADAILLLSLLSGRNPEFLIGQHVIAAPHIKRSKLEILSTAYLLIDGGVPTTVSYISNTTPLPNNKPDIAVATALAGEMIGMKLCYLDAGSGALNPVNSKIILEVKRNVDLPLIVGGGLRSIEDIKIALSSGADYVVIGNAIESNPAFIEDVANLLKTINSQI